MDKKYIVILAQETTSISAQRLYEELRVLAPPHLKVVLLRVGDTSIDEDRLICKPAVTGSAITTEIPIAEIAGVIKRTWGPVRNKALAHCYAFEKKGVPVLNTSHFIAWMHSKIKQYDEMGYLYPETICFNRYFIDNVQAVTSAQREAFVVESVLHAMQQKNMSYPIVFKTNEGARGDGVYLIESEAVLRELITDKMPSITGIATNEIKGGFLLQQFIPTNVDSSISDYYRINCVDQKVHSMVKFQMKWEKQEGKQYKKIMDFSEAEQYPVMLSSFSAAQQQCLLEIASLCPKNGVVGIDAILKGDEIKVLEFNDGPSIEHIEKVANKSLDQQTAEACLMFARATAAACLDTFALQPSLSATMPPVAQASV